MTLHQIQLPLPRLRQSAIQTDAAHDKAVVRHAELVFAGHGFAQCNQLVALEFDQLVAPGAVQVIVLGVTVVVFVDGAAVERHLAQQTRLDHFGQRAINGGAANFFAALCIGLLCLGQVVYKLVRVKVLMARGDLLHDDPTLLCDTLAAALQELFKADEGRRSDFDAAESKILGHNRWQGTGIQEVRNEDPSF